jgi:hypothetical protein
VGWEGEEEERECCDEGPHPAFGHLLPPEEREKAAIFAFSRPLNGRRCPKSG